ncbi:MAG: altronate dehydratase family protein, partial [Betaproteobacteria bacterium]|nr:altronate dehydratase family protein [Betaproteobacteria bacterium]
MSPIPSPVIRLDPADNVVVARVEIPAGTPIPAENLTTLEAIPLGHKIATRAIRKGEPVLKYNTLIGFAGADVAPGTRMHTHNVLFGDFQRDYRFAQDYRPVELLPPGERATFQGIVREDGRVATRNVVGIFVTVNCSTTVARKIAEHFTAERLAAWPNVDAVVACIHDQGCGMEMTGEPMELLRRTIGGYIRNPNTAAALVVSLGCERNNLREFLAAEKLVPGPRLRTLVMQEAGGTAKSIEAGIAMVKEMLPIANAVKRETVSAEHITVGLQCGGSDGFSGLSANPALGVAMDILVRNGGTAILSETPEI